MTDARSPDVVWHPSTIDRATRWAAAGLSGATVWFTGLSGSGKSTVADGVAAHLVESGRAAYVLDGDNVRFGLNGDLGFSAADRAENVRRVGHVDFGASLIDVGSPPGWFEACSIHLLRTCGECIVHRNMSWPESADDGQLEDVINLDAIDLHAHEQPVHQRRGLRILERLALHHVAPVTRAVADRDEERLVRRARRGEGGLAPGMPVHRVVHVLAEVEARLAGEPVGGALCARFGRLHPARLAAPT